jgi:hypothetical protein
VRHFALQGQLLATPLQRAVRGHVIHVLRLALASRLEGVGARHLRSRHPGFHLTSATYPDTRATRTTAGPAESCPDRATGLGGTCDLALHARLMELALQAGNTTGLTKRTSMNSTEARKTPPCDSGLSGQLYQPGVKPRETVPCGISPCKGSS